MNLPEHGIHIFIFLFIAINSAVSVIRELYGSDSPGEGSKDICCCSVRIF